MKAAVIYARYSSNLQRPTSIEDQVARLRDAAPRFDCEEAIRPGPAHSTIFTDAEISGATNQRPGYQALMQAAKVNQFDAILVESQDRLWRDQAEMHDALKRLRFYGVSVFAMNQGVDLTAPSGNIVASAKGMFDEFFLTDLRDKTRRGMAGAIRRRLSAGGRAYGYRSVPVFENGKLVGSRREITSQQAEVVVRIHTLRWKRGWSPKRIVYALNDEKVPSPRPGKGWTVSTLVGSPGKGFGILYNPIYAGYLVWNRTQKIRNPDNADKKTMRARPPEEHMLIPVPELRILPDDLADSLLTRYKEKVVAKARSGSRGGMPRYLFSGLLTCAECGGAYSIHSGPYYRCTTNTNRGPSICSNGKYVRRDRMEDTLLQAIFEEVFDEETVARLSEKVNRVLARMSVAPAEKWAHLESELADARTKLENIKAAILDGIRTPTTAAMLAEWEAKVAKLEATLAVNATSRTKVALHPATVRTHLKNLREGIQDADYGRTVLKRLIGKVVLRRDGDQLVAEMTANLPGLLGLDGNFGRNGAGRGI